MSETVEFLRNVPLFADLADGDLQELCELVESVELQPGDRLFDEGEAGDRAYVIESGHIEILKQSAAGEMLLALRGTGEVIGEMALLESEPRMASARARDVARLLVIRAEVLDQLVERGGSAARALFNNMLGRFRSTTSLLRQNEKMAQLGTLTAGVAHELNNPAAAVQRASAQLQAQLEAQTQTKSQGQGASGTVDAGLRELLSELPPSGDLDALERSDRESELETLLEDAGAPEPWELAPALVEMGFETATLARALQLVGREGIAAISGAATQSGAALLVAEIAEGAKRISEIVKALKSYSYLDRAPTQQVDLRRGIEDTLLILRHKLKGIEVVQEWDDGLPLIDAFASELNQVWTNLIDNAADAVGELSDSVRISLRTGHDERWVWAQVEDNGPGMPADVQERIFDPFFTTKPPGKGTGLGLDISNRIVTLRHGGEIDVASRPGRTCFTVRLPRRS